MGDETPVRKSATTVQVTLEYTQRTMWRLAEMPEPVRLLANRALRSFAARLGDYLAKEVKGISFLGRTKEECFSISFEIFGPHRATIADILVDNQPLDDRCGYIRIERGNTVRLEKVSPRDGVNCCFSTPGFPLSDGLPEDAMITVRDELSERRYDDVLEFHETSSADDTINDIAKFAFLDFLDCKMAELGGDIVQRNLSCMAKRLRRCPTAGNVTAPLLLVRAPWQAARCALICRRSD